MDLQSAMDTKEKSLELMGPFGIVGEAFKIILSQAKLLGTITLLLILPSALITLANHLMASFLLYEVYFLEIPERRKMTLFILIELVWAVLFYAALTPSIASVVYTVASVYKGKQEYTFRAVMRLVPAVWKHMAITFLWYFLIQFVIAVAFSLVVFLLVLAFQAFGLSCALPVMVVCMVFVCVSLYVIMVWQLATVVSVMEEGIYGRDGMKKSRHLIQGKRITAWVLNISYMAILGLFVYAAMLGNIYFVGLGAKIVYAAAYVVLACVITLMWELTQSVLYFVCKSHHGESVDELCSLEGSPEKNNNKKGWQKLEP